MSWDMENIAFINFRGSFHEKKSIFTDSCALPDKQRAISQARAQAA